MNKRYDLTDYERDHLVDILKEEIGTNNKIKLIKVDTGKYELVMYIKSNGGYEGGSDDGSDDGSDGGSDDGSENGFDDSSDDSFEDSSDDSSDDGSEEDCCSFEVNKENEKKSIRIKQISKCVNIESYGNKLLKSFKKFAHDQKFYSVIIGMDASKLEFYVGNKPIEIDLAILRLLSTGKSWYNANGFLAKEQHEQDRNIKTITNTRINRFLRKNNIEIDTSFFKLFKITGKTKIKKIFTKFIKYIKENCSTVTNKCKEDTFDTMRKIELFINAIEKKISYDVYDVFDLEYVVPTQTAGGVKKKRTSTRKRTNTKKRKNTHKNKNKTKRQR
jgi:hypothetical protein